MLGYSTKDFGKAIACGIFCPLSAEIAAFMATATWAGPVPAEEQCKPLAAYWSQSLRKPFSVSPETGIIGCPASSIARTCLLYTSDAPDDLLCVDLGGA